MFNTSWFMIEQYFCAQSMINNNNNLGTIRIFLSRFCPSNTVWWLGVEREQIVVHALDFSMMQLMYNTNWLRFNNIFMPSRCWRTTTIQGRRQYYTPNSINAIRYGDWELAESKLLSTQLVFQFFSWCLIPIDFDWTIFYVLLVSENNNNSGTRRIFLSRFNQRNIVLCFTGE